MSLWLHSCLGGSRQRATVPKVPCRATACDPLGFGRYLVSGKARSSELGARSRTRTVKRMPGPTPPRSMPGARRIAGRWPAFLGVAPLAQSRLSRLSRCRRRAVGRSFGARSSQAETRFSGRFGHLMRVPKRPVQIRPSCHVRRAEDQDLESFPYVHLLKGYSNQSHHPWPVAHGW